MNGGSQKIVLVALCAVATVGVVGCIFDKEGTVNILGFTSMICVALLGILHQIRDSIKLDKAAGHVEDVRNALVKKDAKDDVVAKKAEAAAVKVEEVKAALEASDAKTAASLEEMAKVGRDTHTLVNSNMAVQLKLNAVMARRLADITKSHDDEAAASLAEKLSEEHVTKQNTVDSKEKPEK